MGLKPDLFLIFFELGLAAAHIFKIQAEMSESKWNKGGRTKGDVGQKQRHLCGLHSQCCTLILGGAEEHTTDVPSIVPLPSE